MIRHRKGRVLVWLALTLPLFVPERRREAWFGRRTWLIWLGFALIPCGLYLYFQIREDEAPFIGLLILIGAAVSLYKGYRAVRWKRNSFVTAQDTENSIKWGDS